MSEKPSAAPRLCLNMIVKNESRIIERLIQSVLPIIDTYCICDTGSTDDTPAIIERVMRDANVPGEVVHEPFKNFGYNRTFALQAAKPWGEFALLVDADMKLIITPDFSKTILTPDVGSVSIPQKAGDLEYYNVRIINLQIGATCRCPTHEYYDVPGGYKQIRTNALWINDVGDGGCKSDKFERDIRLLKAGLEEEPNNERYHFYLANSYANIGRPQEAIPHYKRRVELGGWVEEVFYSCLQLGHQYNKLGDHANAVHWWMEGYNRYPKRAESLYEITKLYRIQGKHKLADIFCELGLSIPYPSGDSLFVQTNVYKYDLDYEKTILSYYTKRPINHRKYLDLLSTGRWSSNLVSNYKFYAPRLSELTGVSRHNFSGIEVKQVSDRLDTFVASSPCIIPRPSGEGSGYIMNVRYVNYTIQPNGSYVFRLNDGKITTLNRCFWLRPDLRVEREHWFDAISHPDLRYQGVEDVRIFSDTNGLLHFAGTVQDPVTQKLRMGYGLYKQDKNMLTPTIYESPEGRDCEKNWSFFRGADGATKIVYEWDTLKILDISGTLQSARSDTPGFFRHLRGSSNGAPAGNGEIWFLTHFVEYATPRHYYHMIIVLDEATLAVKRWSTPFKFKGDPIEYGLGLVVESDRILMTYSCWDRSATIMSIPRSVFENEFFSV
jgi:glycosyltransferase involved in cell wall biosynthesis